MSALVIECGKDFGDEDGLFANDIESALGKLID